VVKGEVSDTRYISSERADWMNYTLHATGGRDIAEIISLDAPVRSPQDILDIIVNVPSRFIILRKEMLDGSFFDLKTGLAGDILQKFSNYDKKLAVIGDFSGFTSTSLKDFIYESNKRNDVVFVDSVEAAVDRFSK
jgi:hypothetical protein